MTKDELKGYDKAIANVLYSIAEMRITGDYDENTLETLEWRLTPPVGEEYDLPLDEENK